MNTNKNEETGGGAVPRKQPRHIYEQRCRSWDIEHGEVPRVSDMGERFQLVTNSQDIIATLESIGKGQEHCEVGCLFVEVLDGDYGEVYYCEQSTPYLKDRVYRLQ
jgi:hypothetical protein